MTLVVSNLPASVTGESLLETFGRFGELARVYPVKSSRCVYKRSYSVKNLMYDTVGNGNLYELMNKHTVCSPYMKRDAV